MYVFIQSNSSGWALVEKDSHDSAPNETILDTAMDIFQKTLLDTFLDFVSPFVYRGPFLTLSRWTAISMPFISEIQYKR